MPTETRTWPALHAPATSEVIPTTTDETVLDRVDFRLVLHLANVTAAEADFAAIVQQPLLGLCGIRKVPTRPPFPLGASYCPECWALRTVRT